MPASLIKAEIAQIPHAVETLLTQGAAAIEEAADRMRASAPDLLVFNARGSSDHAGVFAKYHVMQRLGLPVISASPSISSIYKSRLCLPNAACLSISQSGASPDLIETANAMKASGATTLAFTNNPASPLATASDYVVDIHAGSERAVAATKSFICSVVALLQFTAAYGRLEIGETLQELPELLAQDYAAEWTAALTPLSKARGLYILGRGTSYGVAREMALKLKETCQIHAEAYSVAECKHGPLALVGADFPVVVLAQEDESQSSTLAFARQLMDLGAPVMLSGANLPGAVPLPLPRSDSVQAPLLMINAFYKAVTELALSLGHDPDEPPALAKVTETL